MRSSSRREFEGLRVARRLHDATAVKLTTMLIVLCASLAPRIADACTCSERELPIWPHDAAPSVPRNTILFAFGENGAPELSLQETDSGTVVPVTSETIGPDVTLARPVDPLVPDVSYTLLRDGAPQAVFTATGEIDETPPVFDGLVAIGMESMNTSDECISSCDTSEDGSFDRITLDYADPAGASLWVLSIREQSTSVVQRVVVYPLQASSAARFLDSQLCRDARAPEIAPGGTYCASITAHDAAGNTAGGSVERCATVVACAYNVDDVCLPVDGCEPPLPADPVDPGDEPQDASGCAVGRASTTGGLGLLLLAALGGLVARRNGAAAARRSRAPR